MYRLISILLLQFSFSACVAQVEGKLVNTADIGALRPIKCVADTLFVFDCRIGGDRSFLLLPCNSRITDLESIYTKEEICLKEVLQFPLDSITFIRLAERSVIIDNVMFDKNKPTYMVCD